MYNKYLLFLISLISFKKGYTQSTDLLSRTPYVFSNIWTDYGNVYYTNPMNQYNNIDTQSCMNNCLNNLLCGGVTVSDNCRDVFSNICNFCYLNPQAISMNIWPGSFESNNETKTFIIYNKIFPPTKTIKPTETPSASAFPTSSLLINSTWNFCFNKGISVTIPFIGNTVSIMTNPHDTNYQDNELCTININGARINQGYMIYFTNFNTESLYDFIKIYDSSGRIIYINSGSYKPYITYLFKFT
jgi:hypothetical protein